ncbi:NPH-II RNA helicase [Turkeypox virus]|uniref:RNA helicase NPH-II n=1 Tax=Turkeypox virus TaxID=336486 RepID=A0A0M3ZCP5_9POXV|nr:NPH-II RNA helicase [Turkeypox virus]ALA62429.1 NPH-II RNA helicase [Turkeypox virus]
MPLNVFSIYAFPNMYDIFPKKYTQKELEDYHTKNNLFFSYTIFPVIKYRWNDVFVCLSNDTYMLNIENNNINCRKVSIKKLIGITPISIDYEGNKYKISDDKFITFECYSYVKCIAYTRITDISLNDKRGLVIAGNKLSIFSSNRKTSNKESIGILKNKNPFSIITFKSLSLQTQVRIFELLMKRKQIIITGSTGIGKTSQLPKVIMWYNYLFGGWSNLDRIRLDHVSKPVVLSLPRVALVKTNGINLLHSLGFCEFDDSPVELRYGGQLIHTRRQENGIVLSTNKLTSYSLSRYNIVIIDEIHEHDRIADIMIAILRKHIHTIHSLVLMSATLEDDRDRLQNFLPDVEFFHIEGPVLFSIKEIYVKNKFDYESRCYIDEEKKNISSTIKWCKPVNGMCGILFLPSVSECIKYKDYLDSKHPDIDFIIIHGKLNNITEILDDVQNPNRKRPSILVSTPYLESSITIRTATHVYDTGSVYVPKPFGGSQLFISRSMMMQRKGRVGRVSRGTYIYFYDIIRLKPIKNIDNEFLYEYIVYAEKFKLKLPDDLLVVPSNLDILRASEAYIRSFDIPFDKLFDIYVNYFVGMVEYVKIYNKGGRKAFKLDQFERNDILDEETLDDIKNLQLVVRIKTTTRRKGMYLYTGEILFGPYAKTIIKLSSKRFYKQYVYMLTERNFTLY